MPPKKIPSSLLMVRTNSGLQKTAEGALKSEDIGETTLSQENLSEDTTPRIKARTSLGNTPMSYYYRHSNRVAGSPGSGVVTTSSSSVQATYAINQPLDGR